MKKILLFSLFVTMTIAGFAQSNTIKFLGIPVDGTKKEMIAKLQAKGYEYDSYSDVLTGEFNGKDVNINIQTVNNKVWRVSVIDSNFSDETNIKIHFNNLFYQFMNNDKYVLADGKTLTEDDDISYEMTVNNKRYQAVFGFADKSVNGYVWYMIGGNYGQYVIAIFYENLDNAATGDEL